MTTPTFKPGDRVLIPGTVTMVDSDDSLQHQVEMGSGQVNYFDAADLLPAADGEPITPEWLRDAIRAFVAANGTDWPHPTERIDTLTACARYIAAHPATLPALDVDAVARECHKDANIADGPVERVAAIAAVLRRHVAAPTVPPAASATPAATPAFWLVWREGTTPCYDSEPRVRHTTEVAAIAEAKRLAEKHLGATFHVLAACDAYKATVTVERVEAKEGKQP